MQKLKRSLSESANKLNKPIASALTSRKPALPKLQAACKLQYLEDQQPDPELDPTQAQHIQTVQQLDKNKLVQISAIYKAVLNSQAVCLAEVFSFKPALTPDLLQKLFSGLKTVLKASSSCTKDYAFKINSLKVQHQFCKDLKSTEQLRAKLVTQLCLAKQKTQQLLNSCRQNKRKRKQIGQELTQAFTLLNLLQKHMKRNTEIYQLLISTVILYLKTHLRRGISYLGQGLLPYLICLAFLNCQVSLEEIFSQLQTQSKITLLRLAQKKFELRVLQIRLSLFTSNLRRFLQEDRVILACFQEYQNFIRIEETPLHKEQLHKYLQDIYIRNSVSRDQFASLFDGFKKRIQQTAVSSLSQQQIRYLIMRLRMSKLDLQHQFRKEQLIGDALDSIAPQKQIDPELYFQILINQQKLLRVKKTSQQVIRQQTQKNIKKWYSPSHKKIKASRRRTRVKESLAIQLTAVEQVLNYFRDYIFKAHTQLVKQISSLNQEIDSISSQQIQKQARLSTWHRRDRLSFTQVLALLFGKQRSLAELKKRALVRQWQQPGRLDQTLDYLALNSITKLHKKFLLF